MASKRVAIIGAGMSGLSAIKACVEEGFDPVCYEIGDDVGGLWKYSEEVKYGLGHVITPASAPNYLRHDAYQRHLVVRELKKWCMDIQPTDSKWKPI